MRLLFLVDSVQLDVPQDGHDVSIAVYMYMFLSIIKSPIIKKTLYYGLLGIIH